jgi:hypothetical protein
MQKNANALFCLISLLMYRDNVSILYVEKRVLGRAKGDEQHQVPGGYGTSSQLPYFRAVADSSLRRL